MTDYLIKSATAMAVLLAIYHLSLEREKMHRFNRAYLLCAIVFSLAMPFITFTVYKEVAAEPLLGFQEQIPMMVNTIATEEPIDYLPYLFIGIYAAVTMILAFRFIKNLLHFKTAITTNTTIKYEGATLVLLPEKVLPHTFLSYIFINKQEYEDRLIEEELFTHELTHVNQKHTIDILFIETLLMVLWFNPLLYFYKKAIKLNHEFLADESVISHTHNIIYYQKLLLQKAVPATQYYLASSLNFSVTKKRFIMMTKATSKGKAFLLKLAALPVIAALIYTMCTETVAQTTQAEELEAVEIPQAAQLKNPEKDAKRDSYFAGVRIKVTKKARETKSGFAGGDVTLDKIYEQLTAQEKEKYKLWLYVPKPPVKKSPTNKEIEEYKNSKKYAIWIDGKNVANSELSKYKPQDIAYFSGSVILKNARTKKHPQPFQYWFYTHTYFDKNEIGKEKKKYDGDIIEIFEENTDSGENAKSKTVDQASDTIKTNSGLDKNSTSVQNDTVKKKNDLITAERNAKQAKVNAQKAETARQDAVISAQQATTNAEVAKAAQQKAAADAKVAKADSRLSAAERHKAKEQRAQALADKKTAQTTPAAYQEDKVYKGDDVTAKPDYPGGLMEFYKFVNDNFKIAKELNGTVRIYVSFIVEKDGSLSNLKILRDPGYGAGDEAVRVLKESKKWIPANIDGKPVRYNFNLPISINIK